MVLRIIDHIRSDYSRQDTKNTERNSSQREDKESQRTQRTQNAIHRKERAKIRKGRKEHRTQFIAKIRMNKMRKIIILSLFFTWNNDLRIRANSCFSFFLSFYLVYPDIFLLALCVLCESLPSLCDELRSAFFANLCPFFAMNCVCVIGHPSL